MKKRLCILLILSFVCFFTACQQTTVSSKNVDNHSSIQTSEIASSDNNVSSELNVVGASGMTDDEIKDIVKTRIEKTNELYYFRLKDGYENPDLEMEPVYSTDEHNPDGFYWVPVLQYQTRAEYEADVHSIYVQKWAEKQIRDTFGEGIANVTPNSTNDGWDSYKLADLKELDGRLCVRSDFYRPDAKAVPELDFTRIQVVEQTENSVIVKVKETTRTTHWYFTLINENRNWLLEDDGGIDYPSLTEKDEASTA